MADEINKKLSDFFRQLADKIDNNELNNEALIQAFQMLVSWQFNREYPDESMFSEAEMMKFFTMGWFVYEQILKEKR
jgi:hypothetical protein